jgi:hypothetical protein
MIVFTQKICITEKDVALDRLKRSKNPAKAGFFQELDQAG